MKRGWSIDNLVSIWNPIGICLGLNGNLNGLVKVALRVRLNVRRDSVPKSGWIDGRRAHPWFARQEGAPCGSPQPTDTPRGGGVADGRPSGTKREDPYINFCKINHLQLQTHRMSGCAATGWQERGGGRPRSL